MSRYFQIIFFLSLLLIDFLHSFHHYEPKRFRISKDRFSLSMAIVKNFDALLFDCDGVIAETERDVHRISFNQAFQSKGWNNIEWSVPEYGELLKIGGGKERMRYYFDREGLWPTILPSISSTSATEETIEKEKKALLQELHLMKTNMFRKVIEAGYVPTRPGVLRLMDDAIENNIKIAVCSTSNEAAVRTIGEVLLGAERLSKTLIFAGDVVAKKKPSPDIYQLAATTLNVSPSRCWVIEDSEIGLKAALAAGMRCCVTKSVYTANEAFTGADIVVSDLDQGLDGPVTVYYLDYKAKSINKGSASSNPFSTTGASSSSGGKENASLFGKDVNFSDFISKMKDK